MGNETIYHIALQNLNDLHNGDDTFEKICHILAKDFLPSYSFFCPSGGRGRSDGGRDGFDEDKNARMACSIEKKYKTKIKTEIDKKGKETELFYFTNQNISEPEKLQIENEYKTIIAVHLFALEDFEQEIKKFFTSRYSPELYDLLGLSFLINGEKMRRGESTKIDCSDFQNELYRKKIIIKDIDKNSFPIDFPPSDNPLEDFLFSQFSQCTQENFKNIFLQGIGNIGKTSIMKLTYNTLINKFSDDKNLYNSEHELLYKFCPFPYFFELKNYEEFFFNKSKLNKYDPFLFFLDGLDELSDELKLKLKKEIADMLLQNKNVKFIIAGRDASFISGITDIFKKNVLIIQMQKYSDSKDIELQKLKIKYKGNSYIGELLPLPAFRNFLQNHQTKENLSNKDLYTQLVISKLTSDKKNRDEVACISSQNTSFINKIIADLSKFCFLLFCNNKKNFNQVFFGEKIQNTSEQNFILNSVLIDYSDKDCISFSANYYYEFFVANYFVNRSFEYIVKFFFLSDRQTIKVQTLSIFEILLTLLDKKSKAYQLLYTKLARMDNSILLTEFDEMNNARERYEKYCEIIKQRNKEKKYVYYGRFFPTNDIFANIESLAGSLTNLLPEVYYTEAVTRNTEKIELFLNNPTKEEIMPFANSVILLGVYREPIWNIVQQTMIRKISLPLIHFFLLNDLAKEIDGLLSENVVLDWYATYKWVEGWSISDWNSFLKNSMKQDIFIDGDINDSREFRFKLKIFNRFYENKNIQLLIKPLIFYIFKVLSTEHFNQGFSEIPGTVDDDYQVPVFHFDTDIGLLGEILKRYEVSIDWLVDIFKFVATNNLKIDQSSDTEIIDIYSQLMNQFKNKISEVEEKHEYDFYEILSFFTRFETGSFLDLELLNKIQDSVKILLVENIYNNIMTTSVPRDCSIDFVLYPLLNIENEAKAKQLLDLFNKTEIIGVYKSIIYYLNSNRIQNHILYNGGKELYSIYFKEEIKREKERQEKIQKFEQQEKEMLNQEPKLLLDKNLLETEIKKALTFIDNDENFSSTSLGTNIPMTDTEFAKCVSLEISHVKNSLKYDFKNEYKVPPAFSPVIINLLRDSSFYEKNRKINRDSLFKYIDKSYSGNNFWRFFYFYYIKNIKKEEIKKILSENKELQDKFETTMKAEVSELFCKQHLVDFEEGRNRCWVAPFANCLSIIYNNNLPISFGINREDPLKLCVFPGFLLSTTNGANVVGIFTWETYSSIFQWLEEIWKYTTDELLQECFQILPQVKGDTSRAQIFDFFIENTGDSNFWDQIIEAIIIESKNQIKFKQYTTLKQVLIRFWQNCRNNYVNKLIDIYDIGYIKGTENDLFREIHRYVCRMADYKQRKKIIAKMKKYFYDQQVFTFLVQLGYKKAVIKQIDEYLINSTMESSVEDKFELGFEKKHSTQLLKKFIQLYKYAIEKNSYRRNILLGVARSGIRQHIEKRNFFIFQKEMQKIILQRFKNNQDKEVIEDYVNEMRQMVFI